MLIERSVPSLPLRDIVFAETFDSLAPNEVAFFGLWFCPAAYTFSKSGTVPASKRLDEEFKAPVMLQAGWIQEAHGAQRTETLTEVKPKKAIPCSYTVRHSFIFALFYEQ
jgi:hypothetical protein